MEQFYYHLGFNVYEVPDCRALIVKTTIILLSGCYNTKKPGYTPASFACQLCRRSTSSHYIQLIFIKKYVFGIRINSKSIFDSYSTNLSLLNLFLLNYKKDIETVQDNDYLCNISLKLVHYFFLKFR